MNIFTEHPKPKVKIGVLFLKRKRAGFVPEWGEYIEKEVKQQLAGSCFEVFYPEIKIVDSITLRTALRQCEENNCQVMTAVQPTMSDGRMAPVLGKEIDTPVVFWATPEKQTGDMISACSLVGAHTFCASLAQIGHPFEFVYGMPGESKTETDFANSVYRAYAYKAIRNSYSGLVGYHAPGFIDMHVDPFTLQSGLNNELMHIGLQEFSDGVKNISDAEAAQDMSKFLTQPLIRPAEISDADLLLSSKYYIYMKDLN